MPGTEQGVRWRARREKWPGRKRQASGGGWEYPIECLPPDTQQVLLAQVSVLGAESQDRPPDPTEITAGPGCSSPPDGQEYSSSPEATPAPGEGPAGVAVSDLQPASAPAPGNVPENVPEFAQEAGSTDPATRPPAPPPPSPDRRFGELEGRKLRLRAQTEAEVNERQRLEGLTQSLAISDKGQQRIDARLSLLKAVEQFAQAQGYTITNAQPLFAVRYNAGEELGVPPEARAAIPSVSAGSLINWRRIVQTEGLSRLAGNYGTRKGSGRIDTQRELQDLIQGLIDEEPAARVGHILQAVGARNKQRQRMGLDPWEVPSLPILQRWIARYKEENAEKLAFMHRPNEFRHRFMWALGSLAEQFTRLNQRWEMDSTAIDLLFADGKRHMLLGNIDVYSRRARLLVSRTDRATAIGALLRRSLIDWGVPESIVTDNGKPYISQYTLRVLDALDILHIPCPPRQPWKKPFIERLFGTFLHDLVELMPGYIGHNVAERKEIEARALMEKLVYGKGDGKGGGEDPVKLRLSAAEFQQFCDRWTDELYLHRPHEGDGMEGASPFERLAAWREPIRRIPDERALDLLLGEAPGNHGIRTVHPKGIQLFGHGNFYIAAELDGWVQRQVYILYDQIDLARIYVFTPEKQFLAIAYCPELSGISQQEVAVKIHQMQQERLREARHASKELAKKVRTSEAVTEILEESHLSASKVVLLPHASVPHETVALQEATAAVRAAQRQMNPPTATITPEARARARQLMEEFEAREQIEEPRARYKRLRKQDNIAPEEEAWMRRFEKTPEGKAVLEIMEEKARIQAMAEERTRRAAQAG